MMIVSEKHNVLIKTLKKMVIKKVKMKLASLLTLEHLKWPL